MYFDYYIRYCVFHSIHNVYGVHYLHIYTVYVVYNKRVCIVYYGVHCLPIYTGYVYPVLCVFRPVRIMCSVYYAKFVNCVYALCVFVISCLQHRHCELAIVLVVC